VYSVQNRNAVKSSLPFPPLDYSSRVFPIRTSQPSVHAGYETYTRRFYLSKHLFIWIIHPIILDYSTYTPKDTLCLSSLAIKRATCTRSSSMTFDSLESNGTIYMTMVSRPQHPIQLTYKGHIMFRVYLPNVNRWIENIPATEALVYKEEGYFVERMT